MKPWLTALAGALAIGLGALAVLAPYVPLDGRTLAVLLPLGVVVMSVVGLLASRSRPRPRPPTKETA